MTKYQVESYKSVDHLTILTNRKSSFSWLHLIQNYFSKRIHITLLTVHPRQGGQIWGRGKEVGRFTFFLFFFLYSLNMYSSQFMYYFYHLKKFFKVAVCQIQLCQVFSERNLGINKFLCQIKHSYPQTLLHFAYPNIHTSDVTYFQVSPRLNFFSN